MSVVEEKKKKQQKKWSNKMCFFSRYILGVDWWVNARKGKEYMRLRDGGYPS